jgi:TetR/AcrR family transcriptional regulator, transcriptional repressor for nem operon
MARPRTFDEDTVVAAAREQFWNRGYTATSVDDLAAATGLGKSSLYGAFGDKRSLYLRALDEYCSGAVDHVVEQLREPDLPAIDRLTRHIRATAADVAADSGRRGCMMAKSSAELGATDADVDRMISASLGRWREALVDTIGEAKRDGALAATTEPEALATLLLSVIRGFETLRVGGVEPVQISSAAEQAVAILTT